MGKSIKTNQVFAKGTRNIIYPKKSTLINFYIFISLLSQGTSFFNWKMNNIDAKVHVLGTNGTLDGDDTVLREHVLYLDGGKYFKIDNLESSIVNPEMNTSKGFSLSFWIKHGGMLICIINVMQGCQ